MNQLIDEFQVLRERLARDIAGEIVLSSTPEHNIKKWRQIFKIQQKRLADELKISSSVVSDYESGRRSSPGIKVIQKYVRALLNIDEQQGGVVMKTFSKSIPNIPSLSAILDIKEFPGGIPINTLCKQIGATFIGKEARSQEMIYGYTVIDSLKAITDFSIPELIKLYGTTTQRALIFTKVSTGRTPLVAIKLTNLRPGVVILHDLQNVDDVAKRIAEAEHIPLAVCLGSIEQLVQNLRGLYDS
ncbi:MAG: helix-turn-helix domain-containing protein [Nanoarchaeota archaeon]|nr:helix-turn-helix domain-containing protein [Nanoarchaeota archaeon]